MIFFMMIVALTATPQTDNAIRELQVKQSNGCITVVSSESLTVRVSLYNMIGARIHDFGAVRLVQGRTQLECLHEPLTRGVYILLFRKGNQAVTKRLVLP